MSVKSSPLDNMANNFLYCFCYVVVVFVCLFVCFSASPDISIDPPTTNTANTIQKLFQFNQNDMDGDARCINISLLEDLLLEGNETFHIELSLVSSSIVVIIGPCLRYVIILDINSESLSSMTLNRFSLH